MDLEIIKKFENQENQVIDDFKSNLKSNLTVKKDIKEVIFDQGWLDIFEETIPHLETILKNPNRFIVDEEEVVKIELARRITVESIKHLAKNTSLIQSIDEDSGEVQPSKILNINKEEDYNTYENRVIYTLIQNMKFYIYRRKQDLETFNSAQNINNRNYEYTGQTKVGTEDVKLKLELDIKKNFAEGVNDEYIKRIEKVEDLLKILTGLEVYKILEKKRVSLVSPPVKKTNRILKNPDFQYAMKLWDYLQVNMDLQTDIIEEKGEDKNDSYTKALSNEVFLLDYLKTVKDKTDEEIKTPEEETEDLIERLVFVNSHYTKEELGEMILEKYEKIKYRNRITTDEIEKIFKNSLSKIFERIKE